MTKQEVLERFDCVVAVADVTFSVMPGEVFCIMGLSGGGKSTLVRHINRLIEPTSGQVLFRNQDISQMGAAELRNLRSQKIGMVFQHFALLPHRSVRENLAFGLEVRGVAKQERLEIAERVLEVVQLAGWGDYFPDELSGGMKQRVGLGRALASDPEVLLMDEPFSALDPLIRRQLQEEFRQLSTKLSKTTIFITHDLEEAIRLGDHIAIMKDGRIVQLGTPEEIVTRPNCDYVADFVSGISRLKVVRARTIMQPVSRDGDSSGDGPAGACVASPDDLLDHLIRLACDHGHSIIIAEDGRRVGIVSKSTLLRAVLGEDPQVRTLRVEAAQIFFPA